MDANTTRNYPDNHSKNLDICGTDARNEITKIQKCLSVGLVGCLIAALVSLILACLVTFLFWSDISVFLFTGVFFLGAAIVISILRFFLVGPTHANKKMRFFDLAVLFLIVTGMLFGGVGWLLGYPLFTGLSLLSIGFGILVAIAAQLVALHRRTFLGGIFSLMGIVFLFFLLVPTGLVGLRMVCAYVYTPAALTDTNLRVYSACVYFFKAHPVPYRFGLTKPNIVMLGDNSFFIDSATFADEAKTFFSRNDIDELKKLWRQLDTIGCRRFQKYDNILLFYQDAHWVLPTPPGVAYTIESKNPNDIHSEPLNTVKPLTKIVNNWYMSRSLVLEGRRTDKQVCVPKSLIDHSLQIDGIDPNKLDDPNL